ncbi:biotin synthase BioB [bacterium]
MYNIDYYIKTELLTLIEKANNVRKKYINKFDVCTIINAKSGKCTEDCKFCAQSGKHKTEIDIYGLKSTDEILTAAENAKNIGSHRFGIVTSGNKLSKAELDSICDSISKIVNDIGLDVCGSLGALSEESLTKLKQSGMTRYHHNIETSPNHYKNIVTTHNFDERLSTIKIAKKLGFGVCSGGIIGIGESWQDRFDMAQILKDLDVDSVPLNILVPIEGTELENIEPISSKDVIRTICMFRMILENTPIKIAAGRETKLKDFQALGFMAGATGMLIGGYLTVKGSQVEEDQKLIEEVYKLWNA